MARKNIDVDHMNVSGDQIAHPEELHVEVAEDVLIIVTQAFGPRGDSLTGIDGVEFDGYPAVVVDIETPDQGNGRVYLSPFHGDKRKEGFINIRPGTRCTLKCPVSGEPLDALKPGDGERAGYYAIYLTPDLSRGELVSLSDIWDDYNSRIIDNNELVSNWVAEE